MTLCRHSGGGWWLESEFNYRLWLEPSLSQAERKQSGSTFKWGLGGGVSPEFIRARRFLVLIRDNIRLEGKHLLIVESSVFRLVLSSSRSMLFCAIRDFRKCLWQISQIQSVILQSIFLDAFASLLVDKRQFPAFIGHSCNCSTFWISCKIYWTCGHKKVDDFNITMKTENTTRERARKQWELLRNMLLAFGLKQCKKVGRNFLQSFKISKEIMNIFYR